MPLYPDEMCGPRGVKVNECCAGEVEAFADAILEDVFEDGDPCVWRITIAEDATVDGWLTFKIYNGILLVILMIIHITSSWAALSEFQPNSYLWLDVEGR